MADTTTKQQRDMYKEYIQAEEDRIKRKKVELRDDVRMGAAGYDEYVSVNVYNTGLLPKRFTGRIIAEGNRFFGEAKMLATKSDAEICKYYANYESNVATQKKEVANWLKTEDRRQEEIMAYKNNLERAKLQQSNFEESMKAQSASSSRFASTVANGLSDLADGLQGDTADYLSIDC